jgi:soluble lytic murein transglycosylase
MGKRLLAILAGGLILGASCALSQAAVYVYVDEKGLSHFTDAPTTSHYRRLLAFGLPSGTDLTQGPYAELINGIAGEHGIDPLLVKSIIRAESNFDRRAVSRKGAQGLMQLMPDTAFRYAVRNPFDPEDNIRGGVQYLRFLHEIFPDRLSLVVAAYNAGENAVLRHKGIPPYTETQQYVRRVLRYYAQAGERPSVVGVGARPRAQQSPPAGSAPSEVYRQVAPDGSVSFSNVPPLTRDGSAAR